MSLTIRDTIDPTLRRAAQSLKDKRPLLEAMGLQLESLTKRSFNEPALRPIPWPAKSDGSPARLRKNQLLVRSPRVSSVTQSTVTVSSDRPYAAIHQRGGIIRAKPGKSLAFEIGGRTIFAKKVTIPARPFFPFLGDKMTDIARQKIHAVGQAKLASLFKA